jgi:ribosomal-protein-alanine N-acetyltransferase
MKNIEINLNDLILRTLDLSDNLNNYLYWMSHPENNEYILSAKKSYSLTDLQDFIESCNLSPNTILLGIFDTENHAHIGNIKYENIDLANKSADMGILIGEKNYRGRGIAKNVIEESVKWLNVNLGLQTIFLGVDQNHSAAIKIYSKIGFTPENNQLQNGIKMRWDLNVK